MFARLRKAPTHTWAYLRDIHKLKLLDNLKQYNIFNEYSKKMSRYRKTGITGFCIFVFGVLIATVILPAIINDQIKKVGVSS